MKLLLIALIIISTTGYAQTISQDKQAHQKIKGFIAQKYPDVTSTHVLDLSTGYRATFKTPAAKYVSTFSPKGSWEKTERKITLADVPDSVKQALSNSKYSKAKILFVKEIALPQQPSRLYQFKVQCEDYTENALIGPGDYQLSFTPGGALNKEELEPDRTLPYLVY